MKPKLFEKKLNKILEDKTLTEEEKQWKMIIFGLKTMVKESKEARKELHKKYPELFGKNK